MCIRDRYQLERNHVKLVSATEPISEGPAGIMVKSMLTGMAEYYSCLLYTSHKNGTYAKIRQIQSVLPEPTLDNQRHKYVLIDTPADSVPGKQNILQNTFQLVRL